MLQRRFQLRWAKLCPGGAGNLSRKPTGGMCVVMVVPCSAGRCFKGLGCVLGWCAVAGIGAGDGETRGIVYLCSVRFCIGIGEV